MDNVHFRGQKVGAKTNAFGLVVSLYVAVILDVCPIDRFRRAIKNTDIFFRGKDLYCDSIFIVLSLDPCNNQISRSCNRVRCTFACFDLNRSQRQMTGNKLTDLLFNMIIRFINST